MTTDNMIYAELRREGQGDGYHTLRYIVYNGNTIGTYGVMMNADGEAYGASRDFHRIATSAELDDYTAHRGYVNVQPCVYHDEQLCVCDGSSLVEVASSEQRAFEIAAMMADV